MGARTRPAGRGSSPFVGRDPEVAELVAGLADALAGRGELFLIAGEPGIGKTRLVEQVEARALERGARVAWGRCWEGGGAPAYWPWTQVVRALAAPTAASRARATTGPGPMVPPLPGVQGEGPAAAAGPAGPEDRLSSATDRFRLFAEVAAFLEQAAAAGPLVVVLDDLHAADPASLLLLRFIAGSLRTVPLLVVATYREVEAQRRPEVVEALADLVRDGRTLHLRGLDRDEVRRLVEGLSGTTSSDEQVADLVRATGGNPLFIREVVHLRMAVPPGGAPARTVPQGVRAVIHQRLAALEAGTVRVLSVGAVVGQEFDRLLVEQAAGLDAIAVGEALAQAERSDLVGRVPGSERRCRFTHGLVREVLYDELPVAVRRELHGAVGRALERLHAGDLAGHLGELAHHFAHAGGPLARRAGAYARQAGDGAMAAFAYEEAALQFRRALEAGEAAGGDEATRCDLLLRLGEVLARAGEYQAAKERFLQAAEVARRLQVPEAFARAALGYGEPQVEGGVVDRHLLDLLQEALGHLGPDDHPLRARVLARASLELTFADDVVLGEGRREAMSREALAMARRLGDVPALALACRARWMAVWGPDGLEERRGLSEELLRLAAQTGDRELELVARVRRIACALEAGDLRQADADIAAHAALAGELRMPFHQWAAATLRAGRLLLGGALPAAEAQVETAPALLPGRPNARLAHLNQLTVVRWEQGRLAELCGAWEAIDRDFPQAGFARGWLALAEAEQGRPEEGRLHLRALVQALPALPRGGLWLPALAVAALAASALDDADAAAVVAPLLRPYADRTIIVPMPHPVVCFGAAAHYLALLATPLGRWEEAEAHAEAAVQAHTRLGARGLLAHSQCARARLLLRRGGRGDLRRARELLERAGTAAEGLGMVALARQCARLRAEAAGAAAPAASGERTEVAAAPGGGSLFRQEGDYWTIAYEGSVVRLRDTKGLAYLSRLLANPGREFHAIDLQSKRPHGGGPSGERGRQARSSRTPASDSPRSASQSAGLAVRRDLGDAGALLDAQAKAEYRARIRELRAELDEAERFNDPGRAAAAREELAFLTRELARAVGLGGRDRRAASHAERARLNVTRAIRAAVARVARAHPALGRHLAATVHTGQYCSYTPDPQAAIHWEA